MKYVSMTFDDGRDDNYEIAFPIMKEYGLVGTIYCTTGYIDGSWQSNRWKSAGKPISIEQMHMLQKAGWELGLHGDKHVTEVEDLHIALGKMNEWGFESKQFGFSMPDSVSDEKKYKDFVNNYFGKEVQYIRKGRKRNTSTLSSKILFAGYTILGCQMAYNRFNKINVIKTDKIDPENIYTVVVRYEDKPQMITRFLQQLPDETWTVLMFHSILPETHPLYGSDSWNWSNRRFKKLCLDIEKISDLGKIEVKTVSNIYNELYKTI